MTIDATNQTKINRFYRLLPIYRLRLLKFINFEVKSKNKEVNLIVKALNIKALAERNKFIYLTACDQMDEKMADKNICDFKNNKCFVQREKKYDRIDGCCGHEYCIIPHEKGCQTKNLACKLFYCKTVKRAYIIPKAKELKILKVYNLRRQLISRYIFFKRTEKVLKEINRGSVLFILIRDTYLDLKDLVIGAAKLIHLPTKYNNKETRRR